MSRHVAETVQQRAARYVRRYEAGETYRAIAASEGITDVTVVRVIEIAFGWHPLRHPDRPPEFIAEARALRDHGMSFSQIGRALGVSKNVIIGISHRNNWPTGPSPIGIPARDWSSLDPMLLRLRDEERLTWPEIGKRLGMSESAPRHRYDRLKRNARGREPRK